MGRHFSEYLDWQMSNAWMSSPFGPGGFILTFLIAGLLTLIVGTGLVLHYRRTVRRYMLHQTGRWTSAAPAIEPILAAAPNADRSRLWFSDLPVGSDAPEPSEFRAARLAHLKAAAVYAAAGFCHAAIVTVLWLWFAGIAFAPIRTAITFWVFAWPVTLTLIVFWGPDRRRQSLTVLAYVVVLAGFCIWIGAFSATVPTEIGGGSAPSFTVPAYLQPLLVWVSLVWPSSFLLVFLNRRVRSVGPAIFLFMVFSIVGTQVVAFAEHTGPGMTVLLQLLLFLQPIGGFGAPLTVYGPQLLGALLFAIPAWFAVRGMAHHYASKRLSDQSITLDSIWLLMTLFDLMDLTLDRGIFGWVGLLAFGGYKLVLAIGLRPLQRAAARRRSTRLLLLRVFGRRRHSEQLFALLSAHWRYAGSIDLIAGVDLATTTLELREFLDFLGGKLRQSFIYNAADLQRRLDAIDLAPDPDGRFRVNELFCITDTWQEAVTRLIGQTDVVLMDLRGFSFTNAGCIFELQTLVKAVPLDRVALLVDRSTDQNLLEDILLGLMQSKNQASPETRAGDARLRLLRLDGSAAAGVHRFLRLSEEIVATKTVATAPHNKEEYCLLGEGRRPIR